MENEMIQAWSKFLILFNSWLWGLCCNVLICIIMKMHVYSIVPYQFECSAINDLNWFLIWYSMYWLKRGLCVITFSTPCLKIVQLVTVWDIQSGWWYHKYLRHNSHFCHIGIILKLSPLAKGLLQTTFPNVFFLMKIKVFALRLD